MYTVMRVVDIEVLIKYFVFNSVSSVFLLGGFCCYFFFEEPVLGIIFFYMGRGGKLGLYPWAVWRIDRYSKCTFLGRVVLLLLFKFPYLMFFFKWGRGEFFVGRRGGRVSDFLVGIGFISVVVAGVGRLVQVSNFIRFFAYSSSVQMGYIVILIGTIGVNYSSILYSRFFFFIYIVVIWLIAVFRQECEVWVSGDAQFFSLIRGWVRGGIRILVSVLVLMLAGFPIFVGFIPKYALFFSLFNAGFWCRFRGLIVGGVVVLVYYGRVIKFLWFDYGKLSYNCDNKV
jgi:NADH:ubiquinone oxidoreductase subunit 2 (subunit N)